MSLIDELYQETILDHYQEPHNRGTLENPDIFNRGFNPLCGDEINVYINIHDNTISAIRFNGQGCSISQASASIMSGALEGKTLPEAFNAIQAFKHMMLKGGDNLSHIGEEFEDLEAFEGVKKYPVRIKCALLSWNSLLEGLEKYKARINQI